MNKNITVVVLIIVVGAGAFFGGTKYQQEKTQSTFRQMAEQRGGVGGQQRTGVASTNGNRMGFRPVNGEITSVDDKSITVKMQDGSSRIVILAEKTTLNKASEASKGDLKVGEKVAVFGTDNSDGSVTAQNIQLNPINQFMNRVSITPEPTK